MSFDPFPLIWMQVSTGIVQQAGGLSHFSIQIITFGKFAHDLQHVQGMLEPSGRQDILHKGIIRVSGQ